jgi:hypothetical protein
MDSAILEDFRDKFKGQGILGIFVHSPRINIIQRPIRADIKRTIVKNCCVVCGSLSDIICDHKNDIYNDTDVLNTKTQKLEDFQPLCNHCNLQKRQIFKDETRDVKVYSAKKLARYNVFPFEFPWEKKVFDLTDKNTKVDTYWYDPVEFNRKLYIYICFYPVLKQIKSRQIEFLKGQSKF